MLFDPNMTLMLRDAMPWAGPFFATISELGSETFYVVFFLIGYWTVNKRESVIAIFLMLVSVASNYWLKLAIANPRPDQATYWYPGQQPTNYSTPSGHAQNAASLFGWIAMRIKSLWTALPAVVLIVLIGTSRVYLGVHHLGDVLIGWGVGVVIAASFCAVYKPIGKILSRVRDVTLYFGLFMVGLISLVVSTYVLPLPPNDNFGSLGGVIMGLAVSLPLEKRYIDFSVGSPNKQKWIPLLRVIVGLALVIGTMALLSRFMPSEVVWLRALRYALVVFMGIFVWPFIFTRANFRRKADKP